MSHEPKFRDCSIPNPKDEAESKEEKEKEIKCKKKISNRS